MKTRKQIFNMVLAAMFMGMGLVRPFLTGQIPQIGSVLFPMHIPVLICGLICGWQYGGIVGFITPLLRYALGARRQGACDTDNIKFFMRRRDDPVFAGMARRRNEHRQRSGVYDNGSRN